jgi:hypothetical protein
MEDDNAAIMNHNISMINRNTLHEAVLADAAVIFQKTETAAIEAHDGRHIPNGLISQLNQ